MSMQKKPQMVEAVVFFDDRGICKEMLYPEFEALLDNVVPMPEFVDQQVRLAYVLINPRLLVRAAVFFYLDFDETGHADRGWNLPLRQLAERAGRGPDMGAGPIRLACRSQCPVSWQQMHLWDPNLTAGHNHLVWLRDAARRNNLGLLVEDEPHKVVEPERLQMAPEEQWYASSAETQAQAEQLAREMLQAHEQKAAQTLSQHEDRLASLGQQHEAAVNRLRGTAEKRIQHLQDELQTAQQALAAEAAASATLRQEIERQREAGLRQRQELTAQLRSIEQQGAADLDEERRASEARIAEQTERLGAAYREQLAARDAELDQRNLLEAQLRDDNASLRERLAAVPVPEQGRDTLSRLAERGVVFVVYHPGAGHLTLPLQDISRYLDNPLAYAAGKCLVSESHYRQWLQHYQRPACEGLLSSGERCALPVDRIDSPSRFVPGDSDCCARHKSLGRLRSVTPV
ncbi:MAG: hypothetical protein GAK45_01589 [Pseudomonas citronellolis]|nr:MAG: hypothetical protein GAK45_01589 [Pseudomonas citronellolis]